MKLMLIKVSMSSRRRRRPIHAGRGAIRSPRHVRGLRGIIRQGCGCVDAKPRPRLVGKCKGRGVPVIIGLTRLVGWLIEHGAWGAEPTGKGGPVRWLKCQSVTDSGESKATAGSSQSPMRGFITRGSGEQKCSQMEVENGRMGKRTTKVPMVTSIIKRSPHAPTKMEQQDRQKGKAANRYRSPDSRKAAGDMGSVMIGRAKSNESPCCRESRNAPTDRQ